MHGRFRFSVLGFQSATTNGNLVHSGGNMRGPGDEDGARGPGKAVYFFDPSKHMIEIRYYGEE
jgi:hypothetical protein